jgi:hypothetical protein
LREAKNMAMHGIDQPVLAGMRGGLHQGRIRTSRIEGNGRFGHHGLEQPRRRLYERAPGRDACHVQIEDQREVRLGRRLDQRGRGRQRALQVQPLEAEPPYPGELGPGISGKQPGNAGIEAGVAGVGRETGQRTCPCCGSLWGA